MLSKKKPVLDTKRQAEEVQHTSDVDDDMVEPMLYGGLGEDEDDTKEQEAAALSPIKATAAAKMSKVSVL